MPTMLLAVDDSRTMRRVLELTLGGDYQVVTAASPSEALDHLQTARPSAMLIDVGLGSDSGYQLLGEVRARLPKLPVLLLSSKHAPFDAVRGAAATAHLDKPFETQALLDAVAALLKGAEVERHSAPTNPAFKAVAVGPSPLGSARDGEMAPVSAVQPAGASTFGGRGAPLGMPTSASKAVAASSAATGAAALQEKLGALGLSAAQVDGVLALSREVIEQVVWEVVPVLAETLIREEIRRLTAEE